MSEDNRLAAGAAPRPSTGEPSMVRRVKEALWPYLHDHITLKAAHDAARNAIEAMREPTGIQIDAALAGDEHWSMNAIPRIRRAYRRMIDAALAAVGEAGENAGLTQASDSLARISSSHPEDGGIREALEKIAAPTTKFDKTNSPNAWAEVLAIRAYAHAALNPAPLPIGEEK